MKSLDITANGINEAFIKVIDALDKDGQETTPRGQKVKELLNVSIKVENPKKRILSLPIRKISLPYAFGELLWYLTGRNDVDMMLHYSRIMKNFSDDGKTLNSAYGYRIFGHHPMLPFDQWKFVVNKLREDKHSRQAVIHIHTPNNQPTKDEVCTLSLQFLIRNDKLDLIVNMRSNDIVWGFTYDMFNFTVFQEMIANELRVEVGDYYHNAASMHIYEKDFEYLKQVRKLKEEWLYITQYDTEFDLDGLTLNSVEMDAIIDEEEELRTNKWPLVNIHNLELINQNEALKTMLRVFETYNVYKYHSREEALTDLSHDSLYDNMMRNYLSGKRLQSSKLTIVDGPDGSGKTTFVNKHLNVNDLSQVIHYDRRSPDFDKALYFHTAYMTGDIILDRFFYSELAYAETFKREPFLTDKDVKVLERLLNARDAQYILLDTDSDTCYKRLDDEDRSILRTSSIGKLKKAYDEDFGISMIENKLKIEVK